MQNSLEEYFGRHFNGTRLARSLRPSSSTTSFDFKGNDETSDRFASPLGPGGLSGHASTGHSTKHGLPPKLGMKKPFDLVARMPTSLSQGSSPLSFPPATKPSKLFYVNDRARSGLYLLFYRFLNRDTK